MFWRRSSSSTTRCTYGLYRAFTAALWALAAFFFAAIPPSLAVKFRALGRAYPGSAPIERGVEDLSDLADPHELHAVAQVLGEVLEIRLVAPGRQDAADAFSLRPPIGRTRPVSVSSPVIAVSSRTQRSSTSDRSAVAIVMPALGPSFGIAPAGTCRWMSWVLKKS